MPDDNSVRRATAKLAGLYANGQTPDPVQEAEARTGLQVAKLDREIRAAHRKSIAPDAVDTAHLVGLLLMWGHPDGDESFARAKRSVYEVLSVTTSLTDADRMSIAKMILGGERA